MNVLEQSLASIAGFERRGYKAKAAERLGVSPCSIYRWQRTGFSPNTATIVWLATDKTANLQELIEFGASLGGVLQERS